MAQSVKKSAVLYSNPNVGVTVYSGEWETRQVAIKEQNHVSLSDANQAISEAMRQAQLDHPNICRVYNCFLDESQSGFVRTVIIEELMEGDLMKKITDRTATRSYWTEGELVQMLQQLSSALDYAQKRDISHRDIKPHNIFLTGRSLVKIGDFGSSSLCNNSKYLLQSIQGTPFFLSPELRRKFVIAMQGGEDSTSYNPFKSDVFSLGITILYAGSLTQPVMLMNANDPSTFESALALLGTMEYLKGIVRKMLAMNPDHRPSFAEIVKVCDHMFYPVSYSTTENSTSFTGNSIRVEEKKCCICKESIRPIAIVGSLDALAKETCSTKCLSTLTELQRKKPPCTHCDIPLTLDMITNRDVVFLPCGHFFHNKACFDTFLNEFLIDFRCRTCGAVIPKELINREMRRGYTDELEATMSETRCHVCFIGTDTTQYGSCNHKICSKCAYGFIGRLFKRRCQICTEIEEYKELGSKPK